MKKDLCLELNKNQIMEFIEMVDRKYKNIITKNLQINGETAIEATCFNDKNKLKNYLFTTTSAWYGNGSMEYSKKVLTPKWIEFLEKSFNDDITLSL